MLAMIKLPKPLRLLLADFRGRTASRSVPGKVRTMGNWRNPRLETIVVLAHSSRVAMVMLSLCVIGLRAEFLYLMVLYVIIIYARLSARGLQLDF